MLQSLWNTRCPFLLWLYCILCLTWMLGFASELVGDETMDREGYQWEPVLEWTLRSPPPAGNPYDLLATATFTHQETGTQIRTGLFYAGEDRWTFRFTGTLAGVWLFETDSQLPELSGRRGKVTIAANPNPKARGFVGHHQNRWIWTGNGQAFVPQLVMYRDLEGFANQPEQIDQDLHLWFEQHGFNGLHVGVGCRWFDFEKDRSSDFDDADPNPDPRTFAALELLIRKTHAAGGFVHLWVWGDEDRRMTPRRWGINGPADQRLQRYMAARLGALPGWTLGYGFDLWEWVDEPELLQWHQYMHQYLGWPHVIGGRVHQHGTPLTRTMTQQLDYVGYETHRPDYETYRTALELHPQRPVFMEDRFRIRNPSPYPEKDYDLEKTRRGLWHSAMAGGVANIWGNLEPEAGPHGMSQPYPNREQIRTNAEFFARYFSAELQVDNHRTDGVCLADVAGQRFLFYAEDAETMRLDLSGTAEAQPVSAVDTKQAYREIPLGELEPKQQQWTAPYKSDWAIVVGPQLK
ncbi:MAG: DUF5060 domain-containing protein [Pirellulaceae bacterium]|nr:DUF5060 domain-containing protein [Pirellulaceae bacterium]